jgi:hypothetical protein
MMGGLNQLSKDSFYTGFHDFIIVFSYSLPFSTPSFSFDSYYLLPENEWTNFLNSYLSGILFSRWNLNYISLVVQVPKCVVLSSGTIFRLLQPGERVPLSMKCVYCIWLCSSCMHPSCPVIVGRSNSRHLHICKHAQLPNPTLILYIFQNRDFFLLYIVLYS